MLPSDLERQKTFYWIKKVSSLTAWKRIFELYQIWAAVAENSIRLADAKGWGTDTALPQSGYAAILNGLAHCEEGVIRLSKGDKRVFKFDANGEFVMAARILSHWKQLINRIKEGENIINEEHTPLWSEFCSAAKDVSRAWEECSMTILEPRYLDEPAQLLYGDWLKEELKNIPQSLISEPVPDPIDNTFVDTNDYIPYSGIWEPIQDAVKKQSLLSLFARKKYPEPPFEVMGSMNYLHSGSKAPMIQLETLSDCIALNTTWRLIWRDDRYVKGIIPGEESDYRFSQPAKIAQDSALLMLSEETLWAETGANVPVTGKWLVESDLGVSLHFNVGEKFPQH